LQLPKTKITCHPLTWAWSSPHGWESSNHARKIPLPLLRYPYVRLHQRWVYVPASQKARGR
jgi:hypothetical protein